MFTFPPPAWMIWFGLKFYDLLSGKNKQHHSTVIPRKQFNVHAASFKQEGLKAVFHYYGAKTIEELLKWCLDLDVKSITLYGFSIENFQRSPQEVEEIFKLFEEKLQVVMKNEEIHKVLL